MVVRRLLALGCTAALAGCVGEPVAPPAPDKATTVVTPGVAVVAQDSAFVIKNDLVTPMYANGYCDELKPTTENFGEYIGEGRAGVPVRVAYPGLKEPLYGLLLLCRLPYGYSGAASRSYRIEIPQNFVDATEGGRMSVVYEPFTFEEQEHTAWALWLSREQSAFPRWPAGPPPIMPAAPAPAPAAAPGAPAPAPAAEAPAPAPAQPAPAGSPK